MYHCAMVQKPKQIFLLRQQCRVKENLKRINHLNSISFGKKLITMSSVEPGIIIQKNFFAECTVAIEERCISSKRAYKKIPKLIFPLNHHMR